MTPDGGPRPRLAVIVVSWNTRRLLRACLASLREGRPEGEVRIWVVDNGSEDGSAAMVRRDFPEVRLIENGRNVGFSQANNQVLRRTSARTVLLLNPDTEVRPGALEVALARVERTGAVVAARLLNPDGTLQHSAFRFPSPGVDLAEALYLHRLLPPGVRGRLLLGGYWDHGVEREVDWALGAFLMVPRRALDAAGLLSERYPLMGEDMEWCWRLHGAGFPVRYAPEAEVVHHGNQSAGQRSPEWRIRMTHEAKYRFCREHLSPGRARLHHRIDVLQYRVRAALFALLGWPSRRRREQAEEYRRILGVVKGLDPSGERDLTELPSGRATGSAGEDGR